MALSKRKIGSLISINNEKNDLDYDLPFFGINKDKQFMPTVADTNGLDRKKYKIMKRGRFVYSGMQTGRDMCIRIGLFDFDFDALISPAYTTFEITSDEIIPEYFFLLFKSSEMDRYGAFLSDGSIRSNLDWNVFCDIELNIPNIIVQQKYVDIYLGIQKNLDAMTRGVEQMQRTCDAYMQALIATVPKSAISAYIEQTDIRNTDLTFGIDDVRGITTQREFIPTKANMNGVSLQNYKVVNPKWYAYVSDTSRRGDKISLAYNRSDDTYLVSSITTIFEMKPESTVLPDYLFMYLRKPEFDRFARYNSWGSARETITWDDFGRYEIPVPSVEIQQDIVNIFNAYNTRRLLVDKLTDLQKRICPILIKGATEEGGR